MVTTDGERVWVFRYSSEGRTRSLYYTKDVSTLRVLYPELELLGEVSDDARLVVSEPIGDLPGAWNEAPERHFGVFGRGEDEIRPFTVTMPSRPTRVGGSQRSSPVADAVR